MPKCKEYLEFRLLIYSHVEHPLRDMPTLGKLLKNEFNFLLTRVPHAILQTEETDGLMKLLFHYKYVFECFHFLVNISIFKKALGVLVI